MINSNGPLVIYRIQHTINSPERSKVNDGVCGSSSCGKFKLLFELKKV